MLVTGATGRVGANLVDRLVSSGVTVRAFVRPDSPHRAKLAAFPGVEIADGDLRDTEAIEDACRDVTHVAHLAARMTLGDGPVDDFYDLNAFSTLRLLEGVIRQAPGLRRFVLASTDSTYRPGAPVAVPLTEDVPQEPADYYGTSKLLGELILRNRAAQFDLPFSIVRYGTVLSPEEADNLYRLGFLRGWLRAQQSAGRRSTLWPLFEGRPDLAAIVDAATPGEPPDTAAGFIGPDGPWTLSAVDVRDAAEATILALTEPGAVGRAFNIVAAEPITADAGAAAVAETFGVPKVLVPLPFTWRLELSIDAARAHLGYRPAYDYRATVEAGLATNLPPADRFVPAAEGADGVLAALSGGNARG
ncbi:UDP-glucose 4-epimerase [Prauserella muralis]|nr:UDP-glucose 4-epimerase [Prauserella muralis]